ncbi:hypothetical protein KR215_010853 [Drosophila sulfurigaster]|uniref:uncharacterized protein LOC132789993 n=1 Tax=Drosophila nasuta TaxID=42062 RepID=UPI00295E55F9|nr:uncharacterized protein LOC132789993 [Drosophila nasuta]KAH8408684.1 hypothetical protein KR215_010853 [Drosophila sulfurigaster]
MTTTTTTTINGSNAVQQRRQLLRNVESLRGRVRQVLKCVINLHIEFLVLESNVAVLLDEVRSLNDDFAEVERLDRLIDTLRDYNGPTICHEWPYPLIFKGTVDKAQILNEELELELDLDLKLELEVEVAKQLQLSASEMTSRRRPRTKLLRFTGTRKANGTGKS